MSGETNTHAVLGPSKADQWMTCLGSTEASLGIPNYTSEYAQEGTDHHEVAAVCLEEGLHTSELVGRPMLSGAPLTEENAAYVQNYVDYVRAHVDADGTLLAEERVPIGHLTGEPNAEGTADAVVLRTDRELFVGDLKFGRGVVVEAERNRQAMMYALGAIKKHDLDGEYDTVRLAICQPRNGGNKEWVIPMAELLEFGEEVKRVAKTVLPAVNPTTGELLFAKNLPRTPSEKACRFCKAKATCEVLQRTVTDSMLVGFDMIDMPSATTPSSLAQMVDHTELHYLPFVIDNLSPPDKLGRLMEVGNLAELWLKAIRARVEHELLAGNPVTGFKLVQGKKGNRKWTDEELVEQQLKSFRLSKEQMYNFSLISPTDAEKLFKKNPKRWDLLKKLYGQSDGPIHVAPVSDKREAYIPEKPEDGFEVLTEQVGTEITPDVCDLV